jgi:hypothetical protein
VAERINAAGGLAVGGETCDVGIAAREIIDLGTAATLPVTALQGDEIVWKHQQSHTHVYAGVLTDGRPVVTDELK